MNTFLSTNFLNGFNFEFKGIDLKSIEEGFAEVPKHPVAIFALIGLLVLAFVLIKVKKVKLTTKIMAHIGMALALGTVLKMIKFYQLPNGGSVSLGSMVPIFIISLFYGSEIGILTGLLFGLLDFLLGPYILHPVQVLFDYPLAFAALGIAGYFKDKNKVQMIFGIVLALIGRFLFHFISGIVFYGSYAEAGQSVAAYSFWYNLSYIGPEGLLCIIILALLPINELYNVINRTLIKK
ncbi:energy-coupled thiamine transporter ThiT [Clostridium sp. SYSU_GA19001]|uniref:energy-coupled thiamine transporter ThiT n=1 Tax=Clostridium caldaquaticum TaxID=2940653 RepID=UPI00207721A8|nr:energy-coupled thiamine transporter ThiT [Clostridium caldaquaticum]MCM8710701.1 energy-coupled thiamine transporter ThiT [Clostridium caldaquaticum]